MFRDDQQAQAIQNDELRREVERLRWENAALRGVIATAVPQPTPLTQRAVYRVDPLPLGEAERIALGAHRLEAFPVWLAVLLHLLTFGIFSIVYYAAQGARLPVIERDDPGIGKGIGYFLIPYFNLYWMFAFPTRLADRINLQLRLRGERPMVSSSLLVACAISSALFVVPFLWVLGVVQLQRAVNRVVALGPVMPSPQAASLSGVRVDLGGATSDVPAPEWAEQAAWEAARSERAEGR